MIWMPAANHTPQALAPLLAPPIDSALVAVVGFPSARLSSGQPRFVAPA
jgi:hypothetical protein